MRERGYRVFNHSFFKAVIEFAQCDKLPFSYVNYSERLVIINDHLTRTELPLDQFDTHPLMKLITWIDVLEKTFKNFKYRMRFLEYFVFYRFILWYFQIFLYGDSNHFKKRDEFGAFQKLLGLMKTFKDPVAILEITDVLKYLLIDFTKDMTSFYEYFHLYQMILLEMAERLGGLGEGDSAINLFYCAFNSITQKITKWGEYHEPIHQIFFESSSFTEILLKRSNTEEDWPQVIVLTQYPRLKDLFQTDPFKFFKNWSLQDQLPLLFYVMRHFSFQPIGENEYWLGNFRQLIRPVCKASLLVQKLDKYIDLAEICFNNKLCQLEWKIYKHLCEGIENLLINCSASIYRTNREEEDSSRFDGNEEYLEDTFKGLDNKITKLIEHSPIENEEGFLSDLFNSFFVKWVCYDISYSRIYRAIINKFPELSKRIVKQLFEDPKIEVIISTPSELIRDDLIRFFREHYQKVGYSTLVFEEDVYLRLLDAHPYLDQLFQELWQQYRSGIRRELRYLSRNSDLNNSRD